MLVYNIRAQIKVLYFW